VETYQAATLEWPSGDKRMENNHANFSDGCQIQSDAKVLYPWLWLSARSRFDRARTFHACPVPLS
jgi:hypothetical protein